MALANVLLQVRQAGVKELLLLGSDLREGRDVDDTLGAKLDRAGKEVGLALEERALDVGALDNALFAAKSLEQACLLYTSPSPRDGLLSRMPSSA